MRTFATAAILTLAAAGFSATAQASDDASILKKEFGTKISGQFQLGDKTFFVPDGGNWILVGTNEYRATTTGSGLGPMMGQATLLDVREGKLVRGMHVRTTLQYSHLNDWMDEPCKRENTLAKIDAMRSYKDQYCVLINHRVGIFRETSGWLRQAGLWILDQKIEVPQTVVEVHMTRYIPSQFMLVTYVFNPEADGFKPSSQPGWRDNDWNKDRVHNDPEKVKYAASLQAWAKEIMPIYEQSFYGKIPPGTKFPEPPFPFRAKSQP